MSRHILSSLPALPALPALPTLLTLGGRHRGGRRFEDVLLAEPDDGALPRNLHVNLTTPFCRIRILRDVAEHVVVARLGVDSFQRLAEIVLVDHRKAAGLLGDHTQTVLRLSNELAPLLRIDLLIDVAHADQAARIDRVHRDVRAVRLTRELAELAREIRVRKFLVLLLLLRQRVGLVRARTVGVL